MPAVICYGANRMRRTASRPTRRSTLIWKRRGCRGCVGSLLAEISPILGAEAKHRGKVIQTNDFADPESSLKTSGEDIIRLLRQAREAGINAEIPNCRRAVQVSHRRGLWPRGARYAHQDCPLKVTKGVQGTLKRSERFDDSLLRVTHCPTARSNCRCVGPNKSRPSARARASTCSTLPSARRSSDVATRAPQYSKMPWSICVRIAPK
jgi:hypothetical protein